MGLPRYINGKPYYDSVHGKPAHECCCEDTTCIQSCGCCFSSDARVTTPAWPAVTFDTSHPDIVPPESIETVIAAVVVMLDKLNELNASYTFDFMRGPYVKNLLPLPNFTTNETDMGEVEWYWQQFTVAASCDVIDGVKYWRQDVTVHVRDVLNFLVEGYAFILTGRRAWGCCGSAATITWTFFRSFGLTPPSNNIDPISLTNPQGTLTVSNNKCCRSTEIDEFGGYECTHTGTENCANNADDATCIPEEPI